MPPPLGARGIMFSVCPTCTWVSWSTQPTVTVLRHVRPSICLSVRPSGEVSTHLPQNAWREWPEILHADVSWPPSELISLWPRSVDFLILALFWLSETGQIWGFGAFPKEHVEGMAWNFACWCILTTFRTGCGLVIFLILVLFWLSQWNWSNLGFPDISWRTHWGNGLKFCMLMYSDHLQNSLHYGYSYTALKPQQIPMFLHISTRVWGRR